ncbi:MAG: bifunctional phosphoribosyl-AMP cyclohydrolase/phosphoribosyl-ATP diphosphatase HisIE [Spirochaetaceae bacterium]|jgi:phosphoribosyl-ATP pyrophosphohydrolase/phosphoribosyl-AMP cyclohydrolase|nr:bifunctional phosphoribosyl-AMP cyclohydrolase/phosphoribosyl-ATP diphosphatase HisIE [Spirochaetaceae bacterium]
MVIASIDIQNGQAVQLRQGAKLALKRDDCVALAREFDRYGEVAVIDLDAAMGRGSNLDAVKPLLHIAECRVGGGIRSAEQASELVSLGAKKIIVGSAAFRTERGFALNGDFLGALANAIGRERLIVAVDARNGEIVVDGWKTPTGLKLIETAKLVEKYAGELLFTCVEKEGMLGGADTGLVKELRAAVSCLVTAAGGVSTIEEIETLAAIGCDVQLGMALYTGKIDLAEAFAVSINWKKAADGLLPLIAQSSDGQVLMTGFTGREALIETFRRGNVCFHSRTRDRLWMKGENSGNTMKLLRLRADCDRDALLAFVEPHGPVCHTGAWSCFETGRRYTPQYLQEIIGQRLRDAPAGSYTASLTGERVRRKVMEEAYEVCTAKTHDEVVWEAADLLYHMTVLLSQENVKIQEVLDELDRRAFSRSSKNHVQTKKEA